MRVRLTIFAGFLAAFVLLSACASYRREQRAEAEQREEYLTKLETSGRVEPGTIKLPQPRERVEEYKATPTPTPTPAGLLNRPLDPAGVPQPQPPQ